MMHRVNFWRVVLASVAMSSAVLGQTNAATDAASSAARSKLDEWLSAHVKKTELPIRIQVVSSDALAALFPRQAFFTGTEIYAPMMVVPPAPLKKQNIFVVSGKDVTHVTSKGDLEDYFKKNLPACDTDGAMKRAADAWAALTVEFSADGWFQFSAKPASVEGKDATVDINVVPSGYDTGKISAKLSFADGKLSSVTEARDVKGMRPAGR